MSASVISSAMEQNISQGSMIRRMFEAGIELRKKYGADAVCDFSLGNPDLAPPAEAARAMAALAERLDTPGILGYMPNGGFAWAREKVAAWLSVQQGVEIPSSRVMLGCGAAGVMNAFFHTVLEPGDEVLTVAPFFGEYRFYTANHGGVLRPVPCRAEDFGPDVEALAAAVTPKTRALILNSPNNPCGAVYSREDIAAVAAMLPVLDNLERALAQPTADEAYKKGVEMTMNQLKTVLEKLGITEIPALGEQFDPQIHNAVMHVEQEGCDDNTVVEVFQKGFIMGERVVRHAIVKVAN